MSLRRGFRTSEVAKFVGLTLRQLGHWDSTGLFSPSLAQAEGKGSARLYSFLDIVQLKIAKRLLDAGISTNRLRKCLNYLKNNLKEESLASLSLVTDGKGIFMLTDDTHLIVDLLKKGQVVLALDLGNIQNEIDKSKLITGEQDQNLVSNEDDWLGRLNII